MARRLRSHLRAVEQWLDRTVTTGLARTFPAPVDLVELSSALRAECDAHLAPIGGGREVAPNEYVVTIAPADLPQESDRDVVDHLLSMLDQHTSARGYSLAGPLAIEIHRDPDAPTGVLRIRAAILTGKGFRDEAPLGLLIGARRIGVSDRDLRIGRDDGMDLRLDDVGVSRHHCDIRYAAGSLSIHDRDSTNGTIVNGLRVTKAELKHGDVIRLGSTELIVDIRS